VALLVGANDAAVDDAAPVVGLTTADAGRIVLAGTTPASTRRGAPAVVPAAVAALPRAADHGADPRLYARLRGLLASRVDVAAARWGLAEHLTSGPAGPGRHPAAAGWPCRPA
jgi:hypothetical protein